MRLSPIKIKLVKLLTAIVKSARHDKNTMETIIAESWNTDKTSTLQQRYNVYRYNNPSLPSKAHCETQLIQRIRWKCGDNLKWDKVDVYLYRELKDGSLGMSRPCKSCLHLLIDCGITHIYYTTDNGFAEEKLIQK